MINSNDNNGNHPINLSEPPIEVQTESTQPVGIHNLYVQPEAQPYLVLATEITRMAMAGETPETIQKFVADQLTLLGGKLDESAILYWQNTFDFYQGVLRERMRRQESDELQLRWPWASWNEHIDPPDPGMLMIVGAPDGVGKTVIIENIAEQIAKDGGHIVIFHLELAPELMMDRRAARNAGIDRRELRTNVTDDTIRIVRDADMTMMSWPGQITYVHSPGWSIDKISAVVRALNEKNQIDMVLIDYLQKVGYVKEQLMAFGADVNSRVADTVERFKTLAEQQGLPFVLVSQMRKEAKSANAKTLSREMLLGTGSTSNRSNVIIVMTREKDEDGVMTPIIHVKIDKNTMGKTGAFLQVLNGPRFDIRDFTGSDITIPIT